MVKLGTWPDVSVSAFSRLVKEKSLTGICSRSDAPPWESVLRTRESVLLARLEAREKDRCPRDFATAMLPPGELPPDADATGDTENRLPLLLILRSRSSVG